MGNYLSFRENKIHYKNYLWLLLIALLAYWPLTFNVFSVKNDAIHYFLPYRFHISEAIRNGELPLWSPYIYLGYPIYGDMQSGAWNPIVWILSLISRYDVTLFHAENLIYIILGAIGMYKLCKRLVDDPCTSFLVACSYMLSGFMLSGQLINWLGAAAFFPFVIHYYTLLVRSPRLSYAIKAAIAMYLLFTAGYPSFFIITLYILLALFVLSIINRIREKENRDISWKKWLVQHALLLLVFAGLSLPAIISYIDLLPYYNRGSGTSYSDSIINSFDLRHLSSFLFPSSIKAIDLASNTDVTFRNLYVGIFALVALICFPPKLTKRNSLLLLMVLLAFLFSLGDLTPVRKWAYEMIPLLDTFRHPSMMRLFMIAGILLLLAPGLKQLINVDPDIRKRKTKTLVIPFTIAVALALILALVKSNLANNWKLLSSSGAKSFLDNLSFADTILVNSLIQLLFLLLFILLVLKAKQFKKPYTLLWVTNLILFAQLVLPITFVSSISPKEINAFIHASPKGFPVAGLDQSLAANSAGNTDHFEKIALTTFYNKKIGISRISNSPAFLDEQDQFLHSEKLFNYVASMPIVYVADSVLSNSDTTLLTSAAPCKYATTDLPVFVADTCASGNKAVVSKLSANRFTIETETFGSGLLVLSQSYHHHWKVWIDGLKVKTYKTNTGFIGVGLGAGKHTVEFRFSPGNTLGAMSAMLITLLGLLAMLIIKLIKSGKKAIE